MKLYNLNCIGNNGKINTTTHKNNNTVIHLNIKSKHKLLTTQCKNNNKEIIDHIQGVFNKFPDFFCTGI